MGPMRFKFLKSLAGKGLCVCDPSWAGPSLFPRGREAGRAEGEKRVARSCVLSGCLGVSPLQQTLSVSCHERGTLHFVDKEAEKQLSKGGGGKTRGQRSTSPEEKEPRGWSCNRNTLGAWGCLRPLRFSLLCAAQVPFHPLDVPGAKPQAGAAAPGRTPKL